MKPDPAEEAETQLPSDNASRSVPQATLKGVIGVVLCVPFWIGMAFFSALAGGRLGGLREGGWNYQVLPLIAMAVYGGPVVGVFSHLIFFGSGRTFWKSVMMACIAVPALSFIGSLVCYKVTSS